MSIFWPRLWQAASLLSEVLRYSVPLRLCRASFRVVHPLPRSRGPNHALQRTEAGGRVYLAPHVLIRQPLSLSLSSLGPESFLPCWWAARWFPLSLARRFPFSPFRVRHASCRLAASFVRPFRPEAPVIPPADPTRVPVQPLCRRGPNHALQRTEAGGGAFFAIHVLRRQPLSLSLSSLGTATCRLGCFEGRLLAILFVAGGTLPPTSSQYTPVPARVVPSARPFFGYVLSSVHPFPAAWPLIPPPMGCRSFRPLADKARCRHGRAHSPADGLSLVPAVQRPLCRRGA